MSRPDLSRVAALACLAIAACSSGKPPCKSNADCPIGETCEVSKGICLGAVVSNAASSGAPTTSTSSGSHGATTAAASSTGNSSGGPSTSSGSEGGNTTTGGSSGTTGGGGCSCTASCCSQIAGNGITCPDGKACYGTVPDSGAAFYCNYQSGKCDPFDPCDGGSGEWVCNSGGSTGSTGGSTGSTGTTSGAPATVDPMGISFVVVGDTRPDSSSDPYPTQTINQIYTDFSSLPSVPLAVIATGDFEEDSCSTTCIQDYEQAIRLFTAGPTYPTLGNHECVSTSITTMCSVGGGNANFDAFMQMLTDLSIPNSNGQPYYFETLTAPNGDTVKFVITAANAWDSTQQGWLQSTLQNNPTTFTFLSRHEPDDSIGCTDSTADDNTTSSCIFISQVQTIINGIAGSVTAKLEGHTHEIRFDTYNDAIVSGSGGVTPLDCTASSDTTYCPSTGGGYVYCQELTNKTFLCTAYDATTGAVPMTPAPFIVANGMPTGTVSYSN